jgi:beta-glucosidase
MSNYRLAGSALSPQPLALKALSYFLILASSSLINCSGPETPPYKNESLPIEQRVDDLISRMTLDEKIGQMMNAAPAIERLGVPQYNWWSEGLHGVARAGLATVYPQAIGLGATWDEDMMFDVSTAIADEARAKHHDFAKHGKRFLYQGLTLWSPNINIFRDPRWGRGQETYGEDPFLTGRLAVQFVKGLQGDDPKYFKTIATVKHFAVHSGPEPERHLFDAKSNERDFRETYLPQFEMGIKEGKAYSVMCAYNRINGEVCCGSNHLLTQILREEWGFNGYIVSDCEAITDIYKFHKVVATPEEAAAMAVKSGCDLECGKVFAALKKAVEDKIISEEEVNTAVKRLFMARFKLGMFDEDKNVPYANIPYSVVDSKEHRQLALDAARKSMVLLKNDNNTLPLKKDIGTLAVIGPNADQWLMLLGNYNGVPADPITPLRGIREKVSKNTKVLYAQGSALADGMPLFETVPSDVLSSGGKPGLLVEYFDDQELAGRTALYTETVQNLDVNWKNKSPREGMDDDNFAVRWTGEITPKESGLYQIGAISTCKVNVFWADTVIAKTVYHFRDEYGDPRLRKSIPIRLEAGKSYKFKVEAQETYADAQVQLVWDHLGESEKVKLRNEAIATARQADAVVMFMGLTARLEGEEMDVEVEGFRGGDRTSLDLPKAQADLIKAIRQLGKPVILVLLNGSALSINWESENVPAIVEAWYPGQAAGEAIADVLFGDYNPGGKLPVTFYRSANDLPSFDDYHMKGHTYRYFKGTPLYPFGYGLSYTTFAYSNLDIKNNVVQGDSLTLKVTVRNNGKVDGDEVVQVYISSGAEDSPLRSLAAFKRIHLKAGEEKVVELVLRPDSFVSYDETGKKVFIANDYKVSVGGGQPGYSKTAEATVKLETEK